MRDVAISATVPMATHSNWRLKKYHELPWLRSACTDEALSTITRPSTVSSPTMISSIT